jgi:protein-disulfide isomerase
LRRDRDRRNESKEIASEETDMKLRALVAIILAVGTGLATYGQNSDPQEQAAKSAAQASTPSNEAAIEKRVEQFLRNVYAWGPDFEVKAGPVNPSETGLYEVPVKVTADGQSDTATVYVTKDGRYMFRGEIQDLNGDPLAETRQELHLEGYPSKGPANAKVVLVEFADFECPVCRQLDQALRELLVKYPQVRLVFKDFPIEQIHPWAMTAAIAGRCVLQQSPEAFWKFHDALYDNQDLVSPENAYKKLTDLAVAAGARPDALQACMADPKTAEPIHKSIDEAHSLQVMATPTTFVDGRRIVGPDPTLLDQFIKFDLNRP